MNRHCFGEIAPVRHSVEQLRGIEWVRVRQTYALLARKFEVDWKRRSYDSNDWDTSDLPNRCLSSATACLHGLTEAAVLAAGYAPAIGFLHTGKPRSFVHDQAISGRQTQPCRRRSGSRPRHRKANLICP